MQDIINTINKVDESYGSSINVDDLMLELSRYTHKHSIPVKIDGTRYSMTVNYGLTPEIILQKS